MKKENGITLIALVISIIVLLILAGVTIATLTGDNGLLIKSKSAVDKYSEGEIEEQIKLTYQEWQMGRLNNENLNMKEFIKPKLENIFGQENVDISGTKILTIKIANNNKEYEYILKDDGNISVPTEWIDNGNETYTKGNVTIKIGDYINYKEPENLEYAGGWRVLGFENGQIKLLSAVNVDKITLLKREGYLTGISQLNTFCEEYVDGSYSNYARSIKMDDICKLADYDKTTYSPPDYPSYGSTYTYKLTDEGVQYKKGDEEYVTDTSIKKFVKPDETELAKGEEITVTSTYYDRARMGMSDRSIKYNMIFNVNYNNEIPNISYFVADTYTLPVPNKGEVRWSLMYVHPAGISFENRYPIWSSKGSGSSSSLGVRPVVYLKSFVEIDTVNGQKDGTTAELAYEIK